LTKIAIAAKFKVMNVEREKDRADRLDEFRSKIDWRLASLDKGEGVNGEAVFAQLRKKSERRRAKQR
jgi:hypothetical protein